MLLTVLILGRFTDECKKVLDALREELRKGNYGEIPSGYQWLLCLTVFPAGNLTSSGPVLPSVVFRVPH
jgi:hypothetical protein